MTPARVQKPEGQPTRGKTASNRLRRVDNFLLLYEPSLLTRTDGRFAASFFVDLGYGFDARTTLESAARFRRVNPTLPILGVEIDKERVEAALPFADALTRFRLGGFNLPMKSGEHVRLIRAFNVLRQYDEKDFAPAYERLAEYVLPGGLMIEGTSTPFGQIWSANLARKMDDGSWNMEALVFSTNFRLGFDVEEFQTILPKNYIHRVVKGEPIFDFIEAWKRSAAETAHAKTFGLRQWFIAAAEALVRKGFKIDVKKKWLTKGYLIWEF
ncbi:MAG: methylase [Anaerolineaceae bacterium]|nr:MAG: methylase [Anaerolineaceae bacterium]